MKPNPEALFEETLATMDLYRNLDTEIFREIARLLRTDGTQGVQEWHLEALRNANMLDERVAEMLANVSGQAHGEITTMINNAANSSISQVDAELAGILGVANRSQNTVNLVNAFRNQIFLDIDNFVNQTLITTHHGPGSTTQMLQGIINTITANFANGNVTLSQAIESTILSWSRRGVSTVFIDRGGNSWSLERYVDTVLRSILNRTYNELRMSRMRDYGVHTAIVTSLMDSAPRCIDIQGQIIDTRPPGQARSGFPSLFDFGYPAPDGPFGINCRHSMIPFIPGVNENNQPQYDRMETIERSAQTAQQRELERRIRRSRKDIMILEELDSPSLERRRNTLERQQGVLNDLINSTDHLSRNRSRERVYTPRADIMRDLGE